MQILRSNKLVQTVIVDISKGDLDGGKIGSYNAPLTIPSGSLITSLWCSIFTGFSTLAGGLFSIGTPKNNTLFVTGGGFFDITELPELNIAPNNYTGNDLLQTNTLDSGISGIGLVKMDTSGTITFTISTGAFTIGAARFDFEYLFSQ